MNLKNMMLMKQARHKAHMIYDSIDMKCPEQANPETGSRLVVARDWGRVDGE